MYGLPLNFDASVFVGKELSLVSFTMNNVHISFDEEHSITLESPFVYRPDPASAEITQDIPGPSSNIMCLLGKKVLHAEGRKDGFLKLDFEGGGSIICLDDSDQYESYHLRVGSKQIDV